MSEYKKRERRQVSFNTEDAVELELLKFADREDINFSGLVKNLLFAYRMGMLQPHGQTPDMSSFSGPIAGGQLSGSVPSAPSSSSLKQIKASGMPFDL
jgi:hypothetical protein